MKIDKLNGMGKQYPKHDILSFFLELARIGVTDEADKVICLVRGYAEELVAGDGMGIDDVSVTPEMALKMIIASETDIALSSLKNILSLISFSTAICRCVRRRKDYIVVLIIVYRSHATRHSQFVELAKLHPNRKRNLKKYFEEGLRF